MRIALAAILLYSCLTVESKTLAVILLLACIAMLAAPKRR